MSERDREHEGPRGAPGDETSRDALEAAVSALRPSDERGSSVLVVGATTAERAQRVRALLDRAAIEGAHAGLAPPLLVRVHAEVAARAREGRSLFDEVSSAIEEALDAEGAPGALPTSDDEQAPGVASLGAWLFRARSAGRRGLLLVLDEADAWIDARGLLPTADPRRSALAWLDELLEACEQRPVSLLVSTRAADETGLAAIPSPVVGRFAHMQHLGGAPVCERDPYALVQRLAGRSFTLRALERALSGWLDLAQGDRDTVVRFVGAKVATAPPEREAGASSETLLPEAPAENEDAAPRDSDVILARENPAQRDALAPAPPSTDEPRISQVQPVEPRAPQTEAPVTERTASAWRDGVRAAITLRELLGAYRALPQPVRGSARLERAFVDVVSKIPLALEALAVGERETGLEHTRARTEATRALQDFSLEFAQQYASEFERWLAGAPRPTMLCDLPGMLARVATEKSAHASALVLCTGLRFDAWTSLKGSLLAKAPGVSVLSEGALWAARPAHTSAQRELLARGLNALGGALPPRDEPTAPRTLSEAAKPRREHLGRVEVQRIDAYAMALAKTDERTRSLRDALERGEKYALTGLLELLRSLGENAVVALAGDVGVNPPVGALISGPDRAATFGADAPTAVVVPYALLHAPGAAAPPRRSSRKT